MGLKMQVNATRQSTPMTMTDGQVPSQDTTTETTPTTKETSEQLTLLPYQNTTSSVRDFLARVFLMLESGEDSQILEAHSSLRYAECYGLNNLTMYSLKISKKFSGMITLKPFIPSLHRFQNWGSIVNGKCLTANVRVYPKIETGCSLLELLETNPSDKYYLSSIQQERVIAHTLKLRKKNYGYQPCLLSITKHLGKVLLSKRKDDTGCLRQKNLNDYKASLMIGQNMD